ncbi:MAG: hypothetical protein SVY10_14265 [Thermodesulfobacteriota bacterium]|nr:hypothetical protein [Thermodesulfobacteriota bacterium]
MNTLKKMNVVLLSLSIICLYFPRTTLAEQNQLYTQKSITKEITRHPPEILSTSEEDIPIVEVPKKRMNKWVWIGLGVLLAGGAAAVSGGGDDGGGNGDSSPPPDTGDVTIQW